MFSAGNLVSEILAIVAQCDTKAMNDADVIALLRRREIIPAHVAGAENEGPFLRILRGIEVSSTDVKRAAVIHDLTQLKEKIEGTDRSQVAANRASGARR